MNKKFTNSDVAQKFKTYPKEMRLKLLDLRALILSVAENTEGVGKIEEALKWGDPSFLTSESNSGSMIRINATKVEGQYAVYFLCQTSLVKTFRELYPTKFNFEGNRAMLFDKSSKLPIKELKHCLSMALTYRLAKKNKLI